ncbi:MAG TPA: CAP domain-containing protein [Solirubrobacteraceae bacterium]|nr:CAP domain-containing protein [Solirubrobacteraceae bacterium]
MATGRRGHDSLRRHLLHAAVCAALFALCVCCSVIASTAPAATLTSHEQAKGASSNASAPVRHRRRRGCARRANFYTLAKAHPKPGVHRRRRPANCRRHRHGAKRNGRHHARSRHGLALVPVPRDGVCANAQVRPSATDLAVVRTATLCLVNRERLSRGERALRANRRLQLAAQGHSEDMSAGDYFEHDGRQGDTPLSRMRASGYIFSSHIGYAIGENIAWATLWMATPKAIVASWMTSPGHRANILDATFRESGVGISPHPLASLAHGQAGAIYTQDFGRIIAP